MNLRGVRPCLGANRSPGFPASVSLSLMIAVLGACGGDGGTEPPASNPHTRISVLRDASGPRLSLTVDGVGGAAFLVGQKSNLYYNEGTDSSIASIDPTACTVTRRWASLTEFLDRARANRLNFLHVELWSVFEPANPFPFLRDGAGKFRVQAAVEQGLWNTQYFDAFRGLVEQASARGIVLHVSLFNHYNIRLSNVGKGLPWAGEPLRAGSTDTGFGIEDEDDDWKLRTRDFLRFKDDSGALTVAGRVQKALIERLLEDIPEQNVIFEPLQAPWILNNPYADALAYARWQSWIISVVRAKEASLGQGNHALFDVNPTPLNVFATIVDGQLNDDFDTLAWKQAYEAGLPGYEGYAEVAMLSYAGGWGMGDPPLGDTIDPYMRERTAHHRRDYPDKLLLFDTDGLNKAFAPLDCTARLGDYVQDIRHGWWDAVVRGKDLSLYPTLWLQKVRNLEATEQLRPGLVHFLNWTIAEPSMQELGRALP